MSFLMMNEATAIGASRPIKVSNTIRDFGVEVILNSTTATKITACTVNLQGGNEKTETCTSTPPTLAVGSTAARVAITAFYYQIAGTNYTIATDAVGKVLTDVGGTAITGTITAGKLGGLKVVGTSSSTIRCIAPDYALTGVQAYDSAALANSAIDGIVIPSTSCYIGKMMLTDAGGGTTFGSTALTTITTFYDAYCPYYTLEAHVLTEAELSAQRAYFTVSGEGAKYIRTYISALTGTGKVTVKLYPLAG